MAPIALPDIMRPAQEQGWLTLFKLAMTFPTGWCLGGGQMVWLLAAEHRVAPLRATDDVDVVVDIRSEPTGIQALNLAWRPLGRDRSRLGQTALDLMLNPNP